MYNFLKIGFLTIGLGLLSISFSPVFYRYVVGNKLVPSDFANGDLYRLSHLNTIKEPVQTCSFVKYVNPEKIDLYLIGDSFSFDLQSNNFLADTTYFGYWDRPLPELQKSANKKVIVLEMAERNIRKRFNTSTLFVESLNSLKNAAVPKSSASLVDNIEANFKGQEDRLRHVLFTNSFLLKIREWKAYLDHFVFRRADKNFVLGKKNKTIFYYEEADSTHEMSAFYPTNQADIVQISTNFENTISYLKKLGFDQVIISIIPNKVTILEPTLGNYNLLLPRLQEKFVAKGIKFVDTYSSFKASKQTLYYTSDSHWNCTGKQWWLTELNHSIKKHNTL
jgi:hypothetical protein